MFHRAQCPTCKVILPWLIFWYDRRVSRGPTQVIFRCPSCQAPQKAEVSKAYRHTRTLQIAVLIPVALICGKLALTSADLLPLVIYLAFALPWFIVSLIIGHHKMTFTKC